MNPTRHPHALAHALAKALGALGLALAIGAAPGCMVAARGQLRGGAVVAYEAPPAPRHEAYQPRSGYVWINGRWDWQNGGWQWVPGHYERERAGYSYEDGRWEQRNGQYHWVEGQWVVGGTGGYHDDRPQVIDHRDGQPGTYTPPPAYTPPPQGPLTATSPAGTAVVVGGQVMIYPSSAPPAPRVEQPGPARGGYLWMRGYWQWNNGQYEWVPGHWERERAGYSWYDGEWRQQDGRWVWIQGEWRASVQTPQIQVRDRRTH